MVSEIYINSTNVVAGILNGATDLTGDFFSAMLLIVMILLLFAVALGLPLEVSALFVLPFLLGCYAFVPNFTAVTGVILIYLGIITAKNFIIK